MADTLILEWQYLLSLTPEAEKTWNEEAFCPWICLKIVFRTWAWLREPTVMIHLPPPVEKIVADVNVTFKIFIFQEMFERIIIIHWLYIYCIFYQLKSHLMTKMKICLKLFNDFEGKKHIFYCHFLWLVFFHYDTTPPLSTASRSSVLLLILIDYPLSKHLIICEL